MYVYINSFKYILIHFNTTLKYNFVLFWTFGLFGFFFLPRINSLQLCQISLPSQPSILFWSSDIFCTTCCLPVLPCNRKEVSLQKVNVFEWRVCCHNMNPNIALKHYKISRTSKNLILPISFENHKTCTGTGY